METKELTQSLSEELIVKVKACNNSEELLALAESEGIAFNKEQLEAISRGDFFDEEKTPSCPFCGSACSKLESGERAVFSTRYKYICNRCLRYFN